MSNTQSASEVEIKGHCPKCGRDRKAHIRGKHVVTWCGEDGTASKDTGMILECCGCETVYFRRDFWFSEWETLTDDPMTGQPRMEGGVEISYWPAPVRRNRPTWLEKIDRDLGKLLNEMYSALDSDLCVLAAIAARTVFDRASQLLGVDARDSFKRKLHRLSADGRISDDEEDILQVLVDAGSAAAHRGWRPTVDELSTMIDVVESFLHRSFIAGGGIKKLKASVPAKPRKV